MRILVVEDESKAAQYLAKGLRENGFVVETTGRGDEAWHLIQHDRSIWSCWISCSPDGMAARFSTNTDDYLVKPFAFSELLARIGSVLRRGPARLPETLQVGDLHIEMARNRLNRGGTRIALTPRES